VDAWEREVNDELRKLKLDRMSDDEREDRAVEAASGCDPKWIAREIDGHRRQLTLTEEFTEPDPDNRTAERDEALEAWAVRAAGRDRGIEVWRELHLPRDGDSEGNGGRDGYRLLGGFEDLCDWLLVEQGPKVGLGGDPVIEELRPVDTFDVMVRDAGRYRLVEVAAYRRSGAFFELAELSRRLAETFAWRQPEAAGFVLSGLWPMIRAIDATYRRGISSIGEFKGLDALEAVDAFDRVEVVLDPNLTVEQVADWWHWVRRTFGTERRKPMRSRTVRLASWAAAPDADKSQSAWVASLGERSDDVAREKAITPEHFTRDLREARRRLLETKTRPS
jgi:hypothetical protein